MGMSLLKFILPGSRGLVTWPIEFYATEWTRLTPLKFIVQFYFCINIVLNRWNTSLVKGRNKYIFS